MSSRLRQVKFFAGAIQDNDRGLVVGRRSFGKGLVQQQIPLPDGSALRLTVARYYTPSGRCIQKPYDNGVEDYYHDFYNRVAHGELFSQDSIEFDESLAYKTKEGRTVYGGGGIMPDVFVPRDTTMITDYFISLRSNGIIYRYALQYSDNHREELEELRSASAISDKLDEYQIMNDFLAYAKDKGVSFNKDQYQISKSLIRQEVKAYIARNIIDNEGFYPMIHEVDETFIKALDEARKL